VLAVPERILKGLLAAKPPLGTTGEKDGTE
jgi:hypothetical protein